MTSPEDERSVLDAVAEENLIVGTEIVQPRWQRVLHFGPMF